MGRPRNGGADCLRHGARVPVALIVAAIAIALAGIAAAVIATRGDDSTPKVLVRTVDAARNDGGAHGHDDAATTAQARRRRTERRSTTPASRRCRHSDYNGALPLLEQAVSALQGTGSLDEAYADYNLAYTRFALGNCDGVLDLLDRSQQIQGHRKEIDRLRHDARKNCQDEG